MSDDDNRGKSGLDGATIALIAIFVVIFLGIGLFVGTCGK